MSLLKLFDFLVDLRCLVDVNVSILMIISVTFEYNIMNIVNEHMCGADYVSYVDS
jgi:hypothetical protein